LSEKIVFLGSGGWGTAMAISACLQGHSVTLWSAFQSEIDGIRAAGENKLLKGVKIPAEIELTSDLSCLSGADVAVMSVPSFAVASVCEKALPFMEEKTVVVNISKGFDENTYERLSLVIKNKIKGHDIVVLSGPSHAEEVSRQIPTALVSSSENHDAAVYIRDVFATDTLRIYTNTDIVGVELGGAIKNVIALACGISDGVGCGDNTKAALITRGLAEIKNLGTAMGASKETFSGLTGIGDLIVTCTSMHSRNRRAGILIGKGEAPERALGEVGTVEGYHAAKIVYNLAKQYGVEMPITESCYNICYNGADTVAEIKLLMTRPFRNEHEDA
jgi:glycerol-3-phosphate dehydrogenase (NAD(P)+)